MLTILIGILMLQNHNVIDVKVGQVYRIEFEVENYGR